MLCKKPIAAAEALILFMVLGCASPNVDPGTAKKGRGYADFYVNDPAPMSWEIWQLDQAGNRTRTLFYDPEPIQNKILRLEFAPGVYRLRVTLLNQVITVPAILEISVEDGRITPIQFTLVPAGETEVETRERSTGSTYAGRYGRRTKIGSYDAQMYQLSPTVGQSQNYLQQKRMPYAQQPVK